MVLSHKLGIITIIISLTAIASALPVTTYFGSGGAAINLQGTLILSPSISTTPAAPFTCDSTVEGAIFYTRDTDAGSGGLCVCTSVDGTTFAWVAGVPAPSACP